MKFLKKLICLFIPLAKVRHRILRHDASLLRVIDNGVERKPHFRELKHIFVMQKKGCKGNVVKIELPIRSLHLSVDFESNDNTVVIHSNNKATCTIIFHDDGGFVEIGHNNVMLSCFMAVTGSGIRIGDNGLFAVDLIFYAGDAHTLLDAKTGAILNERPEPIVVGNHCWIGRGVTLTKNAVLPDETIVGIQAVVTKKFTEKHTALAGVPARVVHQGISWDASSPGEFIQKNPA